MARQTPTVAADDTLTAIYRLQYDEACEVIAARLAERLGVTAPSMSSMLHRLVRDGLIEVDRRRRITLTERGQARAEAMLRRHRLVECLLVDMLGLDWWRAYEEAHLIEHAISPITEELINERLGSPTTSPFGYPVPGSPGCVTNGARSQRTLADMAVGERAEVERVFEEDQELLRFFAEARIGPCVPVELVRHEPARGTVEFALHGGTLSIGYPAARRIWVRTLPGSRAERGAAEGAVNSEDARPPTVPE